jgi:hypothetical protein
MVIVGAVVSTVKYWVEEFWLLKVSLQKKIMSWVPSPTEALRANQWVVESLDIVRFEPESIEYWHIPAEPIVVLNQTELVL